MEKILDHPLHGQIEPAPEITLQPADDHSHGHTAGSNQKGKTETGPVPVEQAGEDIPPPVIGAQDVFGRWRGRRVARQITDGFVGAVRNRGKDHEIAGSFGKGGRTVQFFIIGPFRRVQPKMAPVVKAEDRKIISPFVPDQKGLVIGDKIGKKGDKIGRQKDDQGIIGPLYLLKFLYAPARNGREPENLLPPPMLQSLFKPDPGVYQGQAKVGNDPPDQHQQAGDD